MAIQYGFIVMFSMAFPATSLLAFLNNVIEIRSDAYKLTIVLQRPWPQGAPGLGVWNQIFSILTCCGIVTNTMMLLYTSKFGDHIPNEYKLWWFVGIEHFMFILYLIVTSRAQQHSDQLIMARILLDDQREERKNELSRRDQFRAEVDASRHVLNTPAKSIDQY